MEMQSLNAETRIDQKELASEDIKLLPPVIDWYINKKWRSTQSTRRASKPNLVQASTEALAPYDRLEALLVKTSQENEERLSAMVVSVANELHTHVDNAKASIMKQNGDDGNRRRYPAIWTLMYDQSSSLVTTCELQLLSQLSGRCFQPKRIVIKVPGPVCGKYGVAINVSVSSRAVLCIV